MFHDHENPIEPEYRSMERDIRYSGTYETGHTAPPKRHGCFMALVLTAAILTGSVVASVMRPASSDADASGSTESSAEPGASNLSAVTPESLPNSTAGETTSLTPSDHAGPAELKITDTPDSVPNTTQEGGLSLQEIYKKVSPSTVSISAASYGGTSSGSGIIMTESGYIITNCHVIDEAVQLTVTLHDGRSCEAQLVGKDATSDLAVLRIEAEELTAAEFGNSDQVQVGDIAVAIGDPLGIELRGTMTDGIISAINRNLTIEGRSMTLLQTTAALNEGNSGGPLINCYGQVIGINTAKIGSYYSSGTEGLGFAIPINTAKEIIDQLISVGFVPGRPSLGVQTTVLDSQYRFFYDLPQGLYITEVDPDSNAWAAGLRRGDTITAVNGQSIASQEDLNAALSGCEAGDTVTIVIYRSHRQYQGELILQEAGS